MDIKGAVKNAIAFASESLGPERTANIRLEEIESSTMGDRPVWLITLSNGSRESWDSIIRQGFGLIGAPDTEREYKVFTVAKDNGEVLSMKIRLLAAPSQ